MIKNNPRRIATLKAQKLAKNSEKHAAAAIPARAASRGVDAPGQVTISPNGGLVSEFGIIGNSPIPDDHSLQSSGLRMNCDNGPSPTWHLIQLWLALVGEAGAGATGLAAIKRFALMSTCGPAHSDLPPNQLAIQRIEL
jgi:hypothetical protein